jgi:hypothetical protein
MGDNHLQWPHAGDPCAGKESWEEEEVRRKTSNEEEKRKRSSQTFH